MKQLLTILILLLVSLHSTAQSDTVCYQSTSATYQVINDPNNTYTWTVAAPGVVTTGQGTNLITVNWGTANPGLIPNAVSVFPTNQYGCVGPTVLVDVFVLDLTPVAQPIGLCFTNPCTTLTATPTGGVWSGVGVSGDQFCPSVAGNGVSTLTYTYSAGGCTFSTTTTATVSASPVISPIQHD